MQTSIELLQEIEAWLSMNTEPSKVQISELRKSVREHIEKQKLFDSPIKSKYRYWINKNYTDNAGRLINCDIESFAVEFAEHLCSNQKKMN